jgi:hypothetical protein
VYDDVVPSIMPTREKTWRIVVSFSNREIVTNICLRALKWLERLHGSLTALMCLDSVIDEQSPFGEPKSWIER